ncbi:hypothetical protein [Streptomyces sp. GbtcB6]|uniref:hypothetical protein n=1 Tax=Streptomyces sp. GbtcB6 TaxID=2824751 RepID=UPI001C302E05|nr:hypothetical protein [Streptomyces sp. GbtcB6]
MTTNAPDVNPPLPLTAYAASLAERLPGRWQPDPATTPLAEDPASHRIWDSGPMAYTAYETADLRRTILTSFDGRQLYVMPRPYRPGQFLVLPMLPAATGHEHVRGFPAPRGLAVRADPARAADAVRRRHLLLDYRVTALAAWRRASTGRLRVDVRFDAEARPRIYAPYARALIELLAHGGFLLDPATGECHLPEGLPPQQAAGLLAASTARLQSLGFTVVFRATHPPVRAAGDPVQPAADQSRGRHL